MRTACTGVGAFLLGIATIALHGDAAQPPGSRRIIRPEKSPNTGLPFSNTYRLGGRAVSVPTSAIRPSASVPRQLR